MKTQVIILGVVGISVLFAAYLGLQSNHLREEASAAELKQAFPFFYDELNYSRTITDDHDDPPVLQNPPSQSTSPNNVTIVTALYDIGRERADHRSFDTYLAWLHKTLTLPFPFVVYVSHLTHLRMHISLRHNPRLFFVPTYDEIPLANFTPLVQDIQADPVWRKHIKDPNDVTHTLSQYVLLQHSKFTWLLDAMRRNPFRTGHFVWLDAGLSRFMDPADFTLHTYLAPTRIVIQPAPFIENIIPPDQLPEFARIHDPSRAIGSTPNYFVGGVFGGPAYLMHSLCEKALVQFFVTMLARRRIDNEQLTLFLVWRRNRDMFALAYNQSYASVRILFN